MKNFFYIVCYDGQIYENIYTDKAFMDTINEWRNGGIIILKDKGAGLHAGSIKNIFREDGYEEYLNMTKVKMYPKRGAWYDGIDGSFIKYEKWRQIEVDESKNKLIEERKEMIANIPENERKNVQENLLPEFNKKKENLVKNLSAKKHE